MEKTCFKCDETKPLSEFYTHKRMADGHLNKCKSCTKKDVKRHRNENLEKVRKYDRLRGRLSHRLKINRERSRNAGPIEKAKRKERARAWIERNLIKRAVHVITGNAIKSGKLKKQPCEVCGKKKVDAHHDDYEQPLEVRWLCRQHHAEHHRQDA